MAYNAKEFSVEISSGTVRVIAFGSGSKTLVMIPGLRLSDINGSARAAAWFYRSFAKDFTVYVLDKKHPADDECTIHSLAEDAAETAKKLRLENVCLFGVSQGGMVAQDIAINHPELVSKLVLAVTAGRNNKTVESIIKSWVTLAESEGLAAVAKDYMYKAYSEGYLKKYKVFIPLAVRLQKFMPVDRFICFANACTTCNTYDRLDMIKCPVLVLGGGKDRIVTAEASMEIAEKLGCEYHIYEGLGHEAYNEAPDFNKRIYDFFMK